MRKWVHAYSGRFTITDLNEGQIRILIVEYFKNIKIGLQRAKLLVVNRISLIIMLDFHASTSQLSLIQRRAARSRPTFQLHSKVWLLGRSSFSGTVPFHFQTETIRKNCRSCLLFYCILLLRVCRSFWLRVKSGLWTARSWFIYL